MFLHKAQPHCGTRTAELNPEGKVIGGTPAQDGEYPWHGAVMRDGVTYACGAALLTPEWAITSATCV